MSTRRTSILGRTDLGPPPPVDLGAHADPRALFDAAAERVARPRSISVTTLSGVEDDPFEIDDHPDYNAEHLFAADEPVVPLFEQEYVTQPDETLDDEVSAEPAIDQDLPRSREGFSLRKRLAMLLVVIGVPAMAAPGDFGALAADAPLENTAQSAAMASADAMPFERAGMSFPGSAFYYLADPPEEALLALPESDGLELGAEGGREIGEVIDAGPAADPFFTSGGGASHMRALDCLSQAVWYEAASESAAGQKAVAQVVLNRVAHPAWPGSVCGVVYQGSNRSTGCQFSFTCDGSLKRRARGASWDRAQQVASAALAGDVYAPIGHATHYHTLWVNPYWAGSLDHVGTIGAHRFYKNRGSAGRKGAFTDRYAGSEPKVGSGNLAAPPAAEFDSALDYAPAAGQERTVPSASGASRVEPVPQSYRPAVSTRPDRKAPNPARNAPIVPEVLADPGLRSSGQAREEYSRAGKWKTDPSTLDLSVDPAPRSPNRPQ